MDMGLQDKIVIVTGGANGIGWGIAQSFAEEGAKILIADWNEEDGNRAVQELASQNAEALYVKMDVRSEDDVDHAIHTALSAWSQVDVLVNNIGTHFYKPIAEISAGDFDRVMQTDLRGHFLMSQRIIPIMKRQGRGAIVNISSIHALSTGIGFTAYAAAKGGINAMTRAMALECAPDIRINAVMPGMSISKEFQKRLDALTAEERKDVLEKAASNTPIGHVGHPMEIGKAVVFLASGQASFITGASLPVDGGESIHLNWK